MVSTRGFPFRLSPIIMISQLDRLRIRTQNLKRRLTPDTSRPGFGRFPRLRRYILPLHHPFRRQFVPIRFIRRPFGRLDFNWAFRYRDSDVLRNFHTCYRHSEYDFSRFWPVRPLWTSEKKRYVSLYTSKWWLVDIFRNPYSAAS